MTILNQNHARASHANRLDGCLQFHDEVCRPVTTQASSQVCLTTSHPLEATSSPSRSILIVPGFQVSFLEASQVLEEYRSTMLAEFPFVPLPSHNVCRMYQEKPFLVKTILWTCRPPAPEASAAFETWFREHIAHQTISLMNKNLELVQALLVFLAWYAD